MRLEDMDELKERKRVKAVMSIFRHARLHVASGNGTLVQAPQTTTRAQEDFLSDATPTENAERS
jgi:hypothetical protein